MDIHISQLEFRYPNQRFGMRVPSLEIASGEQVALVGPSGSGKTTLLRLLAGIQVPEQGALKMDGVDMSSLGDAARRAFRINHIGFVFQDFQLIEYLNVAENIRLPYRIHPALKWDAECAGHLEELAESTGIADKLRCRIGELSQGEKQRVAICRALLARPGLVLADEPTGNLDPANKKRILDILIEETGKRPATMVMVTHDSELLRGFARAIDCMDFQLGGN